jgi:DNA-directed RNA polymerase specialized sigma24 family protein
MVTGSGALTTSTPVLSDAALVERIAALGDRAALAELDARHGMTLYAIAYTLLLNPDAADVTVAATLREAWRRAASFNAREQTAGRWLAELARKAARDQLRRSAMPAGGPPTRRRSACA